MIKKAILPVAGLGTRFLPASKAIPKEMVTVVDRPAIEYVIKEAVAAGIEQIILVTHSSKASIENYFDRNFELETTLEQKKKFDLLKEITDILPESVSVVSVRQPQPLGLGHAVLCAKSIVGDDDFAVLLPDVLVKDSDTRNDLSLMIERYTHSKAAQIIHYPGRFRRGYRLHRHRSAAPRRGRRRWDDGAGLLDRAPALGPRLCRRGGACDGRDRPRLRPPAHRGEPFSRQSGIGPRAAQGRVPAHRQGRATLQPRSRLRSADQWLCARSGRGGGAIAPGGGLVQAAASGRLHAGNSASA